MSSTLPAPAAAEGTTGAFPQTAARIAEARAVLAERFRARPDYLARPALAAEDT